MQTITFEAEPSPLEVDLVRAALGNDVSRLKAAVEPCCGVLAAFRRDGVLVVLLEKAIIPTSATPRATRWSGALRT